MNVAVYWDFENLHASLGTVKFGQSWYKENRYSKQPALVDINSLMEYISGLGNVNINKAYANWSFFFPYSFDLQSHALDLIQMFPRGGHGKNGADIRMAIEVIEDISLHPHIDAVVILGGDSDYISIAQKVRQKGKHIIGIGVKETTNAFWIKSCNEFKFYSTLLVRSSSIEDLESEGYEASDIEDAWELICRAISQLSAQSGEHYVKKAAIKPMMMRLDPSFDESNYGFKSFGAFLDSFDEMLSIVHGEYDHMVALKTDENPSCPLPEPHPAHLYERILRKQQIRLLDTRLMNRGIAETWRLFDERGPVNSYVDYKNQLLDRLKKKGIQASETDISKIKALLYKAFAFKVETDRSGIGLSPVFDSEDHLLHRVHSMLVKRVLDNIDDEPDCEALALMLHGDPVRTEEVNALVAEYQEIEQAG